MTYKIKRKKEKIKSNYYAVYDAQTNRFLETGRNSKSYAEAVEDAFDWWIEGAGLEEEDYKKMQKYSIKQKAEQLASVNLIIRNQKEKYFEGEY